LDAFSLENHKILLGVILVTQENCHSSDRTGLSGKVYLVGAGPGDPGLITLRAVELLREADVVVYDYLAGTSFLEFVSENTEIIYVGKKGREHTAEQIDINDLLVSKAGQGKSVVRLKGGDPFVFGRGGEEAEELTLAGVTFEVVPGVTSAIAAPAYAGIPVTHRDHASMVTFITGHEDPEKETSAVDWNTLARFPGTMVFLMGIKNLPTISSSLISCGKPPDTPAAIVRWGTTPRQVSLLSNLGKISDDAKKCGIAPPAVLVVGSVTLLKDTLSWYEKKSLFGKNILITRTKEQSSRMAHQILINAGQPILFPTIKVVPPETNIEMEKCLRGISEYDWIIFTSVNGVENFFSRFFDIHEDIRVMAGPKLAAIGPVTAQAVRKRGLKVDVTAHEFVAEGLLSQFSPQAVEGKRFLMPRSEKARIVLPEGLTRLGGYVEAVTFYSTCAPTDNDVSKIREMLVKGDIDAVTFTSSSTVKHFCELLGEKDVPSLLERIAVASIGPITSATAADHGLQVSIEAEEYTIDGLLEALCKYFEKRT
jgi:uroporphyrinogen III methyltransferase / synthase